MANNSGRLLALFDELSAFLTKVNLYKGRCITDSHDWAVFELYNANPRTRTTSTCDDEVIDIKHSNWKCKFFDAAY